jgi:hypothetical protein
MTGVYMDPGYTEEQRRERIYAGGIFVLSPNKASLELVQFATGMLREAFGDLDPETAQYAMPVERYAALLAELKPKFIHHPESKRLLRTLLVETGCDPEQTYFDVPRLRSSTSDGYLTTGIAYAFHEHRDTWYSAPFCQVNWWLPVFPLRDDNCMAFHPHHWDAPLPNSSEGYNYQRWNAESRFNAAKQIGVDTRVQPRALEQPRSQPDIRLLPPPGGMIVFSAAQLHSSVPNSSGRTRFSIDFRTVHVGDAAALRGAHNIDSYCTGTAMPDFLRVSDLAHVPEDIVNRYMGPHPQAPRDKELRVR